MKLLIVSLFCTLVGHAASGAVGWNAAVALSAPVTLTAPVLKTVVPGSMKTTAYSTTQYIKAIPTSYSFGAQPQIAYQLPQLHALPTGYYSLFNPSYVPATNIYYPVQSSLISTFGPSVVSGSISPTLPGAPLAPSAPAAINPFFPSQQQSMQPTQSAGDADSTVIDSIDVSSQQQPEQQSQSASSIQSATSQFLPGNISPNLPSSSQTPQESVLAPLFPSNSQFKPQESPSLFPQYTQIPQIPQNAQIPQSSQESGQTSAFPSFPQSPQIPQESTPSFPQFPQIPQKPLIPAQAPSGYPQYPQQSQNPLLAQFPQTIFSQGPSQSPPVSFPAASNQETGLNDEDTVSIESA